MDCNTWPTPARQSAVWGRQWIVLKPCESHDVDRRSAFGTQIDPSRTLHCRMCPATVRELRPEGSRASGGTVEEEDVYEHGGPGARCSGVVCRKAREACSCLVEETDGRRSGKAGQASSKMRAWRVQHTGQLSVLEGYQ